MNAYATGLDAFVAAVSPLDRQARRPRHAFDLFALNPTARLEVGYVLQCRHDEHAAPLTPQVAATLTAAA